MQIVGVPLLCFERVLVWKERGILCRECCRLVSGGSTTVDGHPSISVSGSFVTVTFVYVFLNLQVKR